MKSFKYLLTSFFILFFSVYSVFSWNGLVPLPTDIITLNKWNELIGELNKKISKNNIISGAGINFTGTGNNIIISSSVGGESYPFITNDTAFVLTKGVTKDIIINGYNFTSNSNIKIPGFDGSINSIIVKSPNKILANITAGSIVNTYRLIVSNGNYSNTAWSSNNGNGLIQITNFVLNLDYLYNIGTTFSTPDSMKNEVLSKTNMKLAGILTTGAVAENLLVTNKNGGSLNVGEMTNIYRNDSVSKVYVYYYLNDNFSFVLELTKQDGSNTSLDELLDNQGTSYNYSIKYTGNNYGGLTNYNYSNTTRNWNTGSTFSNDDGGIGVAPGSIDFNSPGPYLDAVLNSWGFGNINAGDDSANILYINGISNPGTVKAYIFLKP